MDEQTPGCPPPGQASRLSRRDVIAASAAMALGGGTAMLAACSREETTASPARRGRSRLTFLPILPPTSLTFAPELFADAAGYFADQRLDVAFNVTRGSPQAIQLVLAGRAALTRISQVEGMRAAANRDAPVLNVGTVFKGSTIRYVSSARAPLREPRDFIGKTIGVPAEGGSSEMELDLLLAVAGIDRARVRRQVVGLAPAVFKLVEQGRIAGYAVSIDTAALLGRHAAVAVLNPGDFMSSGGQFYMASADGVVRHRAAIGKYVAAVRAALRFMVNDDGFDRTLEILRGKYSFEALDDTRVAKASLAQYRDAWTGGGREDLLRVQPSRWENGYAELVGAGLAAGGGLPARWFTNEFAGGDGDGPQGARAAFREEE